VFTCSSKHLGRTTQRGSEPGSQLLARSTDEAGYTLLELLVVALIIGILAAFAIPSFAGQKGKALDAQAKELARTAETTAETVATDNSGLYEKVTAAELNQYEPTIRIAPSTSEAYVSAVTSGKTEYSVTTKATDGDEFKISRSAGGEATRTCVSPITKSGCGGAEKGSW
jgi:prepilin-type N-terminal cleavage/methylation domain-containing protein